VCACRIRFVAEKLTYPFIFSYSFGIDVSASQQLYRTLHPIYVSKTEHFERKQTRKANKRSILKLTNMEGSLPFDRRPCFLLYRCIIDDILFIFTTKTIYMAWEQLRSEPREKFDIFVREVEKRRYICRWNNPRTARKPRLLFYHWS
jgi:hypothetical protein